MHAAIRSHESLQYMFVIISIVIETFYLIIGFFCIHALSFVQIMLISIDTLNLACYTDPTPESPDGVPMVSALRNRSLVRVEPPGARR